MCYTKDFIKIIFYFIKICYTITILNQKGKKLKKNFKSYTASAALISMSVLMLQGCTPQAKPSVKPHVKRSQKLFITTNIATKAVKEKTKFQYTVQLDNIQHTKAELILKNRGEKTLNISSIKLISGPGSKGKIITSNNCPTALTAGKTCKLNVAFLGETKANYGSIIEIKSNDIQNKITNIQVLAEGTDKIHGVVNKVETKHKTAKKTVELQFNALNKVQYIEVKNDGLDVLKLKPPRRSGADASSFSYTTDCKTTLAIGKKCSITVNYDPTKKEGYSDAVIKVPSNGNITPSQYIRLEGYSKPFSINLTNFVISKNVPDFIDDYFSTSKTYYIRTIYQKQTDRFFTNGVDKELKAYFKANNFRLASSASKADKVITLYPSVSVVKNDQTNDIKYDIVVNGHLTTKARNMKLKTANTLAEDYDSNTTHTHFTAIQLNNLVYDSRDFQYGLAIAVDNASDEKEVAATVADIVVSKLCNVLGLNDSKDSK